ncbi:MAG: hypothetical protein ACTSYB_03760, partial [Candidatus Helarchaeota archaeon]
MYETDIVIAGAGPAGCTFALSVSDEISITIIEQKPIIELGHDWIDGFDLRIVKNYEFLKYVDKISDSASINFYTPDGSSRLSAPLIERIDVDRKI